MSWYKKAQTITAYHGTTADFIEWDINQTGKGLDQNGPGIYFTSDYNDAVTYAVLKPGRDSTIFTVNLNLNKVVPLIGKIPKQEIKQMLLWSMGVNSDADVRRMDIETFENSPISNWGENPYRSFMQALASILDSCDGPYDAFQQVWIDYYRYKPFDYIQNMIKLGYDGAIVPSNGNIIHYIVFNTSSINTISKNIIGDDTPKIEENNKEGEKL